MDSIQDDFRDLSTRVERLENLTATLGLTITAQDMEQSGDVHAGSSKARVINGSVDAEIRNMRKAFSQNKRDLQDLKDNVKNDIHELGNKFIAQVENLKINKMQHDRARGNVYF